MIRHLVEADNGRWRSDFTQRLDGPFQILQPLAIAGHAANDAEHVAAKSLSMAVTDNAGVVYGAPEGALGRFPAFAKQLSCSCPDQELRELRGCLVRIEDIQALRGQGVNRRPVTGQQSRLECGHERPAKPDLVACSRRGGACLVCQPICSIEFAFEHCALREEVEDPNRPRIFRRCEALREREEPLGARPVEPDGLLPSERQVLDCGSA